MVVSGQYRDWNGAWATEAESVAIREQADAFRARSLGANQGAKMSSGIGRTLNVVPMEPRRRRWSWGFSVSCSAPAR
jgi:hypothetical protein